MITNDLLDVYPIAAEVVRDWFIEKMAESFKNQELPDNFKDMMRQQGVPNDRLIKLIDVNPRVLFDVFDDNGVIINVVCTEKGFTWDVADVKSVKLYQYRREAESAAVQRAFQILNDKLNVTLVENDA